LCKAWQEKIPERSEDDFLLANQPAGPPWAIRRTRTIFAGKKLKYEFLVEITGKDLEITLGILYRITFCSYGFIVTILWRFNVFYKLSVKL